MKRSPQSGRSIVRTAFFCTLPLLLALILVSRRAPDAAPSPPVDAAAEVSSPQAAPAASRAPETPDLAALTAALVSAIPEDTSAENLFSTTCAACHGPQGEGNRALKAPSIAGLPTWFSLIQFEKFRNGQRGKGEGDFGGSHMAVISEKLPVELLPDLSSHVASLPIVPTTNEIGGDPVVGKTLFMEQCAGCHRYNGHGEKAFRSAPLSGLQDWYLLDSLKKYRAETRGYHRHDIDGIFMHRNLRSVSDKDFTDIVAYIAELAEKYPPGKRRPRADGGRDRDLVR